MEPRFLDDQESEAELVLQMPAQEQAVYRNYGHRWIDSAYIGRTFVLYRAGKHRGAAKVVTLIDVTEVSLTADAGMSCVLRDRNTGETQHVGHVPQRLFKYGVFVQFPVKVVLKWDAIQYDTHSPVVRRLQFALVIKTKNHPKWHNDGNTYIAIPRDFQAQFPQEELKI